MVIRLAFGEYKFLANAVALSEPLQCTYIGTNAHTNIHLNNNIIL